MSIKERNLGQINRTILLLHRLQKESSRPLPLFWARLRLAASMLHFEFVKNDVAIRAQSLSYFTLFSILPLIAGIFLVLGFFSQWGPVQSEFEEALAGMLSSIPDDQRQVLLGYILQFKDQYLKNLSQKSGTIGVFAVLVLFWIGARVFFNVESLMNRIWSVKSERPLFDRLKNFVLTMVFLPFVYALVISLPRVVEHYGHRSVGVLLDQGLLLALVFFTLSVILKGFPNTRVSWKSAMIGSFAGTTGFAVADSVLRIYFRFGTDTAYGKAGVLPVFAFFIYVAWLIFIFSIEVSLLVERGWGVLGRSLPSTTLASALILEKIIHHLNSDFRDARGPKTLSSLALSLGLEEPILEPILDHLVTKEWVARTPGVQPGSADRFVLAREPKDEELLALIEGYLELQDLSRSFDVKALIHRLTGSPRL